MGLSGLGDFCCVEDIVDEDEDDDKGGPFLGAAQGRQMDREIDGYLTSGENVRNVRLELYLETKRPEE